MKVKNILAMPATFHSLDKIDSGDILHCFNESFKDYFIPFHLTTEQFENKLSTEAFDLCLSYGSFENNELTGFILNGVDTIDNVRIAWNGGTGVLPQYRGKKTALFLYEYCIEKLRKGGIEKTILEVFQQNKPAIKTYQAAGFNITRVINSYKGRPGIKDISEIEIEEERAPDWNWINDITAWQPAWQYTHQTLQRAWQQYRLFIAYEKDDPAAFVIFNSSNGRVAQFGAVSSFDEPSYLKSLFSHISNLYEQEITIAHVGSVDAENFLQAIGLQPFVYSYEMERMV